MKLKNIAIERLAINLHEQLSIIQNYRNLFASHKSIKYKFNNNIHELKFEELKRRDYNKLLGDGISSYVFEMIHDNTEKSFAVKKVSKEFYYVQYQAEMYSNQKEFLIETEVLEMIKDINNVVEYYGYFNYESSIWIIYELMDFSLKQFYENAKMLSLTIPESILAKIAYTLLTVIKDLAHIGLMHRDIKPENVLVNSNGEIKLCDFGEVGLINMNNKCENKQKGTIRYKAPEKFNDNSNGYSVKSEIWSIGMTLVEAALLKKPYENVPLYLLEIEIYENSVPTLDKTQYSKQFQDFLSMCLEKDVSKRAGIDTLLNHDFIKLNINEFNNVSFFVNVIKEPNK